MMLCLPLIIVETKPANCQRQSLLTAVRYTTEQAGGTPEHRICRPQAV